MIWRMKAPDETVPFRTLLQILAAKPAGVFSVSPTDTARAALEVMAERRVGFPRGAGRRPARRRDLGARLHAQAGAVWALGRAGTGGRTDDARGDQRDASTALPRLRAADGVVIAALGFLMFMAYKRLQRDPVRADRGAGRGAAHRPGVGGADVHRPVHGQDGGLRAELLPGLPARRHLRQGHRDLRVLPLDRHGGDPGGRRSARCCRSCWSCAISPTAGCPCSLWYSRCIRSRRRCSARPTSPSD
jgi:hypothetical protein